MKVSKVEDDTECLYCADLFSEDHDAEEWSQCQKWLKWAYADHADYPKMTFVCGRCKK